MDKEDGSKRDGRWTISIRDVVTPEPICERDERDLFYRSMAWYGSRLVRHGIPVIFDATATRRSNRNLARNLNPHFLEVGVVCSMEVCVQRDQKGTYQKGTEGKSFMVPGLQDLYEPPLKPDLEIDTTVYSPEAAAAQIMKALEERGYLQAARDLVDRERSMFHVMIGPRTLTG